MQYLYLEACVRCSGDIVDVIVSWQMQSFHSGARAFPQPDTYHSLGSEKHGPVCVHTRADGWPTPSEWATPGGQLPRMTLARLNLILNHKHTRCLLLCGLPPPPPRLKASPRLPARLGTSHSHRTAPRRICFTTRLPHHGCLTPRPPTFQPPAVLAQDPRIAPATAVLRRALLRKWHPTIITPNGPASPAAPTLAASHHGPGRADEHGGAEEIRQRCPSQLPPTGPQQHFAA